MTQQINLYQPERYERRISLSAAQMVSIVAALFFLVMAAGALDYWRSLHLASELNGLQERRDAAIRRIDDYQQRYPARLADPDLTRTLEVLQNERQSRLALLRLLTEGQLGNRCGLSEHLAGLARQDLSTVWLRRIRLGAGGDQILLEGSSTRAADIPLYLQDLAKQKVFAGREFEHLQLNRSEASAPVIDFLLQTNQEGGR